MDPQQETRLGAMLEVPEAESRADVLARRA
jgi:hypothetical protein